VADIGAQGLCRAHLVNCMKRRIRNALLTQAKTWTVFWFYRSITINKKSAITEIKYDNGMEVV
jgi:hypothetical protein